jgi:hypothetical protein
MLVALDESQAEQFAGIMSSIPFGKALQVMKVAHVRAACERMLVTRPLLVAFSEALGGEERKLCAERAQDIMAEIVILPRTIDPSALEKVLESALRRVMAL